MSRTFAVGDLHGCLSAFDTLLALVQPRLGDRLITLGDYVDRGPDSRGVLDRLVALVDTCYLVPLRGNHDIMMQSARTEGSYYRQQWLAVGGDQTLLSYDGSLDNVPPAHWRFLQNTLPYYETATHLFVHAGLDAHTPLAEQSDSTLYWEKLRAPEPHASGKTVIVGHSSQKNGLPLDFGHTLCIDTWACGTGWLSCLDVATGTIYQANQQGETRVLTRDEPLP